jgi:hypothetical protein
MSMSAHTGLQAKIFTTFVLADLVLLATAPAWWTLIASFGCR